MKSESDIHSFQGVNLDMKICIEEKIVRMHHEKRDLADKLLADTDQSAKISSEDLFNLIVENN